MLSYDFIFCLLNVLSCIIHILQRGFVAINRSHASVVPRWTRSSGLSGGKITGATSAELMFLAAS